VGVEGFLLMGARAVCKGGGLGGGRVGKRRVEAENGVGVEAVQGGPAAVPVVGKFSMCTVARNAKFFPFLDVYF
jgi:hypothetical protein